MKKFISCLLTVISIFTALTSCSNRQASIVGSWKLSADFKGTNTAITLKFEENGKGSYSIEGVTSNSFEYEILNNVLYVSNEGDPDKKEIRYTVTEKSLMLTVNGENLIFKHSEPTD